jgi:hypothetical protein
MLTRLRRGEEGFALVTAVFILAIMSMLLIVVLEAGNNAFSVAERNSRYTRTLGVAEAGLGAAVTQLGESRLSSALAPCRIGTGTVCAAAGGEYQVNWSTDTEGTVTVTSIGYYPSKAGAQVTREIKAVYKPIPSFNYAIFSDTSITIKNGQVIYGNIFANQGITIGTNAVICGSVTSAGGGVDTQAGASIVKSYTDGSGRVCSGKTGNVWANGTITLGNTGVVQGDATASAPAGTDCALQTTNYAILGGTVQGKATACGIITATTTNPSAHTWTAPSPPKANATGISPPYTFDPANYTSINCVPISSPCDPAQTSVTAYQVFNGLNKSNMQGVYAVWQTDPHCGQITNAASDQCTKLDLTNMSVGGDLTIVTNAPIYFGNTSPIASTGPARVVIISLYIPGGSSTCTVNGGDCSIYGKNAVVFDSGNANDPNDAIAALLYTPGKMAFKQQTNAADGALYAGSMDIANGFGITFNDRIAQIVGFGGSLQQVLWQEIS